MKSNCRMNPDIPAIYPTHQTNIHRQRKAPPLFLHGDVTASQQIGQNECASLHLTDIHQHLLTLDTTSPTYLTDQWFQGFPCPSYIPSNSQSCHFHRQLLVPSLYRQN